MLDFASFTDLIGRRLGLDLSAASPESLLRDDLDFDSLAMAEMLVLFSDDGISLPEELLPELRTLADLHHYFAVARPTIVATPPAGAAGAARADRVVAR